MSEVDSAELQRVQGGQYVARQDGAIVASVREYDEPSERLAAADVS
jgi:hypothetical protein